MTKSFVENLGFKHLAANNSIFYHQEGDEHTVIAVATDNMAVTSKKKSRHRKFQNGSQKNTGTSPKWTN